MTSNVPQCPVCTFPMRLLDNSDGETFLCRSCGYSQSLKMDDNRYENSIFEMPRDEFMKALEERYREGVVKGWLCGGMLSLMVAVIISGIFLILMAKEINEVMDKAQNRQFMPLGGK